MRCKYCHKNVRSISHFMQAHKQLMLRKMRAGRGSRRRSGSGSRASGGSFRGRHGSKTITITW